MGGYPSSFLALFKRKDPRTPVKGFGPRIKNVAFNNYRGLVGFFLPLALLCWQGDKAKPNITVQCMWWWIFFFFLFQPVNIPVTGLIPLFLLPMAGVMGTVDCCQCYLNENIVLYILTSMLLLLLNNSGIDRRIAIWFITFGDSCQFSSQKLTLKCTTAAFILSMFCSKLIVSSTLIQMVAPAIYSMKGGGPEADFKKVGYVVCNAIQTGSAIGSIGILHASIPVLLFRTIFQQGAEKDKELPDIYNYFQYSAYAIPVAVVMFICNCIYHLVLINKATNHDVSNAGMASLRTALLKLKTGVPKKVSLHEKLSVFFLIFYLVVFFLRWNKFTTGWAGFSVDEANPGIPMVKDATVAAMFAIALHVLPKGAGFLKFLTAEKKSQLPPIKPESAILWWRFVDRNMNYGYMFLFGCAVSITCSSRDSGLNNDLASKHALLFTNYSWNVSIFTVCLMSVILANAMPGTAACTVFAPFILAAGTASAPEIWKANAHLGPLAVGVGSSLGFMCPFLYTPAYFCHYTGKVPKRYMAKYSVGSAIICMLILWLSLCFYAPLLWGEPIALGAALGTTTEPTPKKEEY